MEESRKTSKKGFLHNMSVYPLEFAVAMLTLLILTSILSFASYALAAYLIDADSVSVGAGYFALWTAASTLIWLPVTYIFYLRSQNYSAVHKDLVTNPVQRAFVIIWQVVMIITILSFAFVAIFSALSALASAGNEAETLLRVSLPSFVSVVLFGGALIAFFKRPVMSAKVFANLLLLVSLAIVATTITLSLISLRSANADSYKADDLDAIYSAIENQTADKGVLPTSLNQVKDGLGQSTLNRLDEYTYKKIGTDRYELCATYRGDTSVSDSDDYYAEYPDFYHGNKSGEYCYKIHSSNVGSSYDYDSSYNYL